MKKVIVIAGASGFIGRKLSAYFFPLGWEVRSIARADFRESQSHLVSMLDGSEVLINLSGKPIIQRWTRGNKRLMQESRIDTTQLLVEALQEMKRPPEVFLNASAIGIYPDQGRYNELSDERASGFLGQLCMDWEKVALQAKPLCRVILMRFGIILDARQGALARMLPVFRLGLGGKLGNGNQAFSWMHIDDLVRAIHFIIETKTISGPVNFIAPEVVDNKQYTRLLSKVLRRPAWLTVPAFALRLLFGQGADALLKGQHALPMVLQQHGFDYAYPGLEQALDKLVGPQSPLEKSS